MPECAAYRCKEPPVKGTRWCQEHWKETCIDPKPSACSACPLYEVGEGFALGEGPKHAKVMLIGEALGEEEARLGRPFVGGSGRLLNAMLAQAGVYRSDVYITNVVKCRPPNNREPDDEEIKHCSKYLIQELRDVNPNLIVAAGKTALYATTGQVKIGTYRGIPVEGPKRADGSPRKVLATFHPAFVMRQQSYWPVCVWDLAKAKVEGEFPEIRRVQVLYNTHGDAEVDGPAVLDAAHRAGFIVADLETTDLDPRTAYVRLFGLGSQIGRASTYRWTLQAQHLLFTLLSDPSIEKVGQNSESFDWPFLEEKKRQAGEEWRIAPKTFDTMLAFHLTNSDLPKNLATIATFYTDMPYWKDERMYKSDEEGLAYGCCQDIDGTTRVYLGLKTELHTLGMDDLFYKNVMPLQPVLREMQRRGIKKDEYKAMKWSLAMENVAKQKEEKLRRITGNPFLNVASSKDMMKFLYQDLGLPVQYKRDRDRGVRPTADAEAIEKLVSEYPENAFLRLVGEIRSLRHSASTYMEVPCDENGFVHPRFGCAKAANGRINSWDPNAQNQPIEFREIYTPDDEDHVFISIDWSQVEWRLAMVLSGDPTGLDLLTKGVDNHKAVAAEGFGVAYDSVSEELRHASKFIVYGLGYGRGAKSIAKQLKRPETWVMDFIRRFFNRFSTYAKWRDQLDEQVKQSSFLRNPFGRRRWWYTRQITEMYNFPPSSTAADMMYIACREADSQLPKGATVRLTVHDELVIVSHRDVVKQASECLEDIMNQKWDIVVQASRDPATVRRFYPQGWSCPADCSYGLHNWRETKDKKAQAEFKKELDLV